MSPFYIATYFFTVNYMYELFSKRFSSCWISLIWTGCHKQNVLIWRKKQNLNPCWQIIVCTFCSVDLSHFLHPNSPDRPAHTIELKSTALFPTQCDIVILLLLRILNIRLRNKLCTMMGTFVLFVKKCEAVVLKSTV